MTLLNDLIGRQRQLAQRLAMIECGEVDYEINRDEIKKRLNEFFKIENLNEAWVSALIKRIEVGETLTTEEGPKRDIFVTYAFKKPL